MSRQSNCRSSIAFGGITGENEERERAGKGGGKEGGQMKDAKKERGAKREGGRLKAMKTKQGMSGEQMQNWSVWGGRGVEVPEGGEFSNSAMRSFKPADGPKLPAREKVRLDGSVVAAAVVVTSMLVFLAATVAALVQQNTPKLVSRC
jgi:hypothetical protein